LVRLIFFIYAGIYYWVLAAFLLCYYLYPFILHFITNQNQA